MYVCVVVTVAVMYQPPHHTTSPPSQMSPLFLISRDCYDGVGNGVERGGGAHSDKIGIMMRCNNCSSLHKVLLSNC